MMNRCTSFTLLLIAFGMLTLTVARVGRMRFPRRASCSCQVDSPGQCGNRVCVADVSCSGGSGNGVCVGGFGFGFGGRMGGMMMM